MSWLYRLPAQYFFFPLNQTESIRRISSDSTQPSPQFSFRPAADTLPAQPLNLRESKGSWLNRKLFYEDLVRIEEQEYALRINPVVNFQLSDASDLNQFGYVNTRGFWLEGRIGKKLSFFSAFTENQARFANYFNDYVRQQDVVPGQGSRIRRFGDKAFDYSLPAGGISFKPNEHFLISLGQDRNFIGHGYRSMLLSDAGFTYPQLRINTHFWRIHYTNIWAQMRDINTDISNPNEDAVYARKFFSAHYLEFEVTDRFNLGVFEAVVLGDSTQQRGLDPAFLNPVIFYRPIEFAAGSGVGNVLLGFTADYEFRNGIMIYGQFMLDEFQSANLFSGNGSWVNKFGWQLGFKDYQLGGVEGLFGRIEFNSARPYTYAHRLPLTNYGHYNSALAHPWGANFYELVAQFMFFQNRWEYDFQMTYATIGLDDEQTNWGADIYKSYLSRERDLNNFPGQGNRSSYLYIHARVAWLVNPASRLKLEAGMRYRRLQAASAKAGELTPLGVGESLWGFVGLRTALFNRYYDY